MRKEEEEIYSDASNAAVLRHPGRRFPGVLIQGDTLNNWSGMAKAALKGAAPDSEQYDDLVELTKQLEGYVSHYARVLQEHGMALPFTR